MELIEYILKIFLCKFFKCALIGRYIVFKLIIIYIGCTGFIASFGVATPHAGAAGADAGLRGACVAAAPARARTVVRGTPRAARHGAHGRAALWRAGTGVEGAVGRGRCGGGGL